MRYFLLILFSILFFTGCQKPQAQQIASPDAKRYALHGKIVAADKAKKTVTVAHGDIKDYMPAMTMEFPVKDDFVFDELSKDAEIRAELVVDKAAFWLENVAIVGAPNPNAPAPPANENFVQIGSEVPDFKLTNQDGKQISFADFRGKSLAITFIYTKCPLPNYCILMSKNFSDLSKQIEASAELKDKIRLLSISFDPQTDTPATLKSYGLGYLGKDAKSDFTVWQLATGSEQEIKDIANFFGLRYETDQNNKTLINHSLITVVVAPDGKVSKVFTGNEWTPNDLLRALQTTMKQ